MKNRRTPFDKWLTRKKWQEGLKSAIAIVVIPAVAAWWGFSRFSEAEGPALEYRGRLDSEVKWFPRSARDCLAEYLVTFKNIGRASIDLTEAHVYARLLDDKEPEKAVRFVDPGEQIDVKQALVDQPIQNRLVGHFAPEMSDSAGINFVVKRDPGRIVLFWFTAKAERLEGPLFARLLWFAAKGEPTPILDYHWDYACGDAPETRTTESRRLHK